MKDTEQLKTSAKKFLDGKKNIDLDFLKKYAESTFEIVEKTVANFEKDLTELSSLMLPSGFDLNVRIDSSPKQKVSDERDVHTSMIDKVYISISDNNKKEGEKNPKYFWTMDGNVELEFDNNNLINYDTRSVHGGYNDYEYGNSKNAKIDIIETSEIMMKINTSYLNLMKVAKENPKIFNENIAFYSEAKENHLELRKVINVEQERLDVIKKESEINAIGSVFKPLDDEQVLILGNKLKNSSNDEEKISIVILQTPNNNSNNRTVYLDTIDLMCKNGSKKSFSMRDSSSYDYKRVKSSDIDSVLSSGITVSGNYVESIADLSEQVNRLALTNLIQDKKKSYSAYEKSLAIPMDMMVGISNDLILESPINKEKKVVKKPKI